MVIEIIITLAPIAYVVWHMQSRKGRQKPLNAEPTMVKRPHHVETGEMPKIGGMPKTEQIVWGPLSNLPTKPKQAARHKYADKFRLLNNPEMALYRRLNEAVPSMIVFAQVSLSQVLHLSKNNHEKFRQLGEIGRKSVDFLICRSRDTSIVAAIELNGPHHDTERQKLSDEKKRQALNEAGIPLITFVVSDIPDIKKIRKVLAAQIVSRKKYEIERDMRLQRRSP